jgi:hypothetical protein
MLITTGLEPTREQRAVVDACAAGSDLVIEAGAGTGKTSVLRMASAAMTGRRGVYLAFTRATADSARLSFGPEVQCVTAHALAYRAVGWRYANRLRGGASRMPAWAAARQLGIHEPLRLGRDLIVTPAHQARIVLGTVERFCFSGDERIGGAHVPPVNGVDPASFAELTWRIVPWAERAWHDIRAVNGTLPFRHDHYLKLWQLTRPRISADYLMFDEAQDANPVIVGVVQDQSGLQKVAVGDSCQAIYGWRGAVDALATWPASMRLQLSYSFRFGSAVAHEANNWLEALGAPFLLSGTPQIASTVGPVDAPDAIVCRTNAEALVQARLALAAGRRVALAGGGIEVRQLAVAALELQDTGRTAHPELAAFRSWKAVRDFVRTDAAGADLAASVRLIDKHGPAEVLAIIGQLSSARRADLVVSTAHRAKGLEWDSVQVAGDFRRVLSGETVTRADAMLAYVAVTRARTGLDQTGLDTRRAPRVAGTITKEITMKKAEFDIAFDEGGSPATLLDGDPHVAAEPYSGGRAQAEDGSAIVENDYFGWLAVALEPPGMPPAHPRVVQLGEAWRLVAKFGLGDDPGAASIRYQVLAHAAGALIEPVRDEGFAGEADALQTLRQHSLVHGQRLCATSTDLFSRSGKSGPYSGRGEASGGSRIVEKDYRNWTRTPAATSAAVDPAMWEHADVLQQAWASVERRGLADGPEQAAARYQAVSGFARNLAQDFSYRLPSAALVPLLELAAHADKHAIRLHSTAIARTSGIDYEALCQATWGRSSTAGRETPYGALPAQVAMTAARARSEIPIGGQRPLPTSSPGRRAIPDRTSQNERA